MILRCLFIVICLFSCHRPLYADSLIIRNLVFHAMFGNDVLQQDHSYPLGSTGDSLSISEFKWYISGIQLLKEGHIMYTDKEACHLLDAFQNTTLFIPLSLPSELAFDQMKFNIGIDSLTSVSGALGGDLDPTKGMYWTWQSGYINVKLEGVSSASRARKHEFQFHLGGYQFPFNALQTLVFNARPTQDIHIVVDLSNWFHQIDLSKTDHIMSPSEEAVRLSKIFSMLKIMRP